MNPDNAPLRTARDSHLLILEINRPKARNSLNEAVLTALNTELVAARHDDEIRAIVLTGAGGIFSPEPTSPISTPFATSRCSAIEPRWAAPSGPTWADSRSRSSLRSRASHSAAAASWRLPATSSSPANPPSSVSRR